MNHSPMPPIVVAIATLVALAPVAARAQVRPAQKPAPPRAPQRPGGTPGTQGPPATIEIREDAVFLQANEQTGVPLSQLIQTCHTLTGYNFSWPDPQSGGGDLITNKRIILIGPKIVPKKDFWPFFQTLLKQNDLATLPLGPEDARVIFIQSIKAGGIRRGELVSSAPFIPREKVEEYKDETGQIITTTVNLEYIEAQSTATSLRIYFSDTNVESITPVQQSNSLVITGFAPSVYTAITILKYLDIPPPVLKPQIEIIPLEHAVARELVPVLQNLLESQGGIGGQQGPRVVAPGQEAGGGGRFQFPPRVFPDPRTNSVVVYALEADVASIRGLVIELDRDVDLRQGDIHVYQLKHSKAEDTAQTLNELLTQQRTSQQQQGAGQVGTLATGRNALVQEQFVAVVPDNESNALLIAASSTRWEQIVSLIEELDQPRDQVLLEAALIEISGNINEALGIELAGIGVKGTKGEFAATTFGLTTLVDSDGDLIPDARVPAVDGSGNLPRGFTAGILGSDIGVPFIINALAQQTGSNLLSLPSVLTTVNEQAKIRAVDQVPFQTATSAQGAVGTGFGGFEEAGITLEMLPLISGEDTLRLELTLTVEQFSGTAQDGLPPPKVTREITQTVTLPDGSTMVVGGVLTDTVLGTDTKVPLLGDLPWVGQLFQNSSEQRGKTNLFLFLTPHIIPKDFGELRDITLKKKQQAAALKGKVHLLEEATGGLGIRNPDVPLETLEESGVFEIPSYRSDEGGAKALEESDVSPEALERAEKAAPGDPVEAPPPPERGGSSADRGS